MATAFAQSVICPTLIGRAAHLDALVYLVDLARSGQGRIALITGEAGIGKSRLVAEVKTIATERGLRILQGHCFEPDRAFAYAPLLDLVGAFSAGRSSDELAEAFGSTATELAQWFPELFPWISDVKPAPALDPEHEKRRIFQAFTQFIRQGVGASLRPAPTMVIIEDLHWCDAAGLEWLLFFARQLQAAPILLLLTYRDDESQPALSELLAALDRMQLARQFTLARLTRADVAEMLRVIFDLSRPLTPEFLDTLYTLTEGNPLFVEEVLKSLSASGDIFYADGRWDRKPLNELRIPRTVQVAVHQRTRQLSAEAKYLLTLAAVAGRRFDFALLQAITQESESALLLQVKELMAAQLVVEASAETFAFRHALTREAVHADLLARERQTLHRSLAETMERLYADSPASHAADMAYHFYEAGERAKALAWARRAGERAERLYAHEEALHQYERARQCAAALDQSEQLIAIDEAMGDVYFARGLYDRAVENYERALALTATRATGAALKAKIGIAYLTAEDERGVAYLHTAVDDLNPETQTNELARVTMMLGRLHWLRSQHTQAIEWCERARQLAEPHGDALTIGLIYNYLASNYCGLLQLDESMAWARKTVALGEQHAHQYVVARGYYMLAQCAYIQGRWQDCIEFAKRSGQIDKQIGNANGVWLGECVRAFALRGQGELSAALAMARSLRVPAQTTDNRRWPTLAHTINSMLAADCGDEETARANAEMAIRLTDELAFWVSRSEARRALAYSYTQREQWAQAADLFDQCAELLVVSL